MNIYIEAYGCTANHDDGLIMAGLLEREGHTLTTLDHAELAILQTCVVKDTTNQKINHRLNQIYQTKKLIISGCMAESQYQRVKELYPKAGIINTFYITKINEVVSALDKDKPLHFIGKRKGEVKVGLPKNYNGLANIQIAQGCASVCYFCETKLAKGHIQSQPIDAIKEELKQVVLKGITQINITSTDNGCYGLDLGTNLPKLLKELINVQGNYQLRIGMMNPEHIKKYMYELIDMFKDPRIFPFLHIPIQSGSNQVLELMNRKYTIEECIKIINEFRKEIPNITIATDIIVGYPDEKEADFQKTIEFIKKMNIEVVNISRFSPRPGTIAARLPQLKTKVIKARSKELHEQYKSRKETREVVVKWL